MYKQWYIGYYRRKIMDAMRRRDWKAADKWGHKYFAMVRR